MMNSHAVCGRNDPFSVDNTPATKVSDAHKHEADLPRPRVFLCLNAATDERELLFYGRLSACIRN